VKIDFLFSPAPAGAADQDFARPEVDGNRHLRPRAVARGVGLEGRRRHHREPRLEVLEVGGRRHDEQVAHEQVVPGELLDEADRQAVFGIGTGIQILDEQFLPLEVRNDVAAQRVELLQVNRLVDLAPPDLRVAGRLLDHELVVRRSTGMRAGAAHQGAVNGQLAFPPANGMLVKRCGGEVEVDRLRGLHAVRLETLPHLGGTHKNMTPNMLFLRTVSVVHASKPSMVQMAIR